MSALIEKLKVIPWVMIITIAGMFFVSGCARYSRNADMLYEPSASVHGGSGDVYIVIPANQPRQSPEIKWMLGKVKDDDNNVIDEVVSSRSPAEIIQAAFGLEFTKAGYNVIATTNRPGAETRLIDLTKTEINLDQISDLADLKATCRVLVGVDVFRNGQMIKRFQYESRSSETDIKDRDLLAKSVLQDALKSVMLQAVPELDTLFNR